MVSTTQRERSDRCGVPAPTHKTASERLIITYLPQSIPQHDLKGRMPERSEWLLAEGGAKRNPRYRNIFRDASERRENRLPWRQHSRLSDTFRGGHTAPGVAMTLNPRLRALGLRPRHSAFLVGEHHHHLAAIKHRFPQT